MTRCSIDTSRNRTYAARNPSDGLGSNDGREKVSQFPNIGTLSPSLSHVKEVTSIDDYSPRKQSLVTFVEDLLWVLSKKERRFFAPRLYQLLTDYCTNPHLGEEDEDED